jgi:hypothetical protein
LSFFQVRPLSTQSNRRGALSWKLTQGGRQPFAAPVGKIELGEASRVNRQQYTHGSGLAFVRLAGLLSFCRSNRKIDWSIKRYRRGIPLRRMGSYQAGHFYPVAGWSSLQSSAAPLKLKVAH